MQEHLDQEDDIKINILNKLIIEGIIMKYINMILVILIFINFYCKSEKKNDAIDQSSKPDSLSKELSYYTNEENYEVLNLNRKSVELLSKSALIYNKQIKDSLLNIALMCIDSAIKMDNKFHISYINKANILRSLGEYNQAINCLEEVLKIKEYPEAIFMLGLMNEKIGKQKIANQKYHEALRKYESYLHYLTNY